MRAGLALLVLGVALMIPLTAAFLVYLFAIVLITVGFYHVILGGALALLGGLKILKEYIAKKEREASND
jgi:hypothetical protein